MDTFIKSVTCAASIASLLVSLVTLWQLRRYIGKQLIAGIEKVTK